MGYGISFYRVLWKGGEPSGAPPERVRRLGILVGAQMHALGTGGDAETEKEDAV